MKVISDKPAADGRRRRLIIELDSDEGFLAVKGDSHYRLTYPLDDTVVCGRHVLGSHPVHWCVIEQKWVPSR